MTGRVDFAGIAAALLANFGSVCGKLLPGGRYVANEYLGATRAQGGPGDSLSVNRRTGAWLHGASGASGGDLISLWAYVQGHSGTGAQVTAAREAYTWLGLSDFEQCSIVSSAPIARAIEGPSPDQIEKYRRAEASWRETRPLRGSKAEAYLRGRGLWVSPDAVSLRYSPRAWHSPGRHFPAMIAAVAGPDGKLLGIHQTFVASDGMGKAPVDPAKKMLGAVRGGAVRLGLMARKVAVVEGIETGLAVQNSTGLATLAALSAGGIAALELPAGIEEAVICADNDANAVGIEAANKAAMRWHSQGVVVRVIMPPRIGTDFADLLASGGVDAVCAVVSAAPIWKPDPPSAVSGPSRYLQANAPTYADKGKPLVEARADASDEVQEFFRRGLAWGHNGPPAFRAGNLVPSDQIDAPALALRVGVGIGKTECAVRELTRTDFISANVAYLVPNNDLAGEIAKRGNALSAKRSGELGDAFPRWVHWKGRGQDYSPGVPMCPRYETARKLEAVGVSVAATLCKRRVDTGRPRPDDPTKTIWIDKFCPHHPDAGGECPYIRQTQDEAPAIRVAANALAFIEKSGMPVASLTVLDESFWQASIEGLGDTGEKLFVSIDTIEHVCPKRANLDAQNDAYAARARLLAAVGERKALSVAELNEAGLTNALCAAAAAAWAADWEVAQVFPDDQSETVAAKVDAFESGHGFIARKMWRMWVLLRDELAMIDREHSSRDDIRSVRLGRSRKAKGGGQRDVGFYLSWSRDLQPEIARNPVLVCDATLEQEILERFFPQGIQVQEIDALWSHVEVIQVPDAPTAKTKLVPRKSAGAKDSEAATRRIAELRSALDLIGASIPENGSRGLFVANKAAVEAIQTTGARGAVRNFDAAHFNALAGKDIYRDAPEIVVIGAPVPSAQDLEATARALFWRDPRPIDWLPDDQDFRRLFDEARAVRMRDGSAPIIRVATHPDPLADTVLRAIRDGELIQAIGRARPAGRAASNPLRVLVLGGVVLPMTVDRLLPWVDIVPGPIEAAWGRVALASGVLPLAAVWLHTALSDLFPSLRTAERAAADFGGQNRQSSYWYSIGGMAALAEYRTGQARRWSRALVRTGHPTAESALAAALGEPLAAFRWVDASPPPEPPCNVPPLPAAVPALAGAAEAPDPSIRFLDAGAALVDPARLCGRLAANAGPAAGPAEVVARIGGAHIEGWFSATGALAQTTWRRSGELGMDFDGTILGLLEGSNMDVGNHNELVAGEPWDDAELAKLYEAKRVLEATGLPAADRIRAADFVLRAAGLLPRGEHAESIH